MKNDGNQAVNTNILSSLSKTTEHCISLEITWRRANRKKTQLQSRLLEELTKKINDESGFNFYLNPIKNMNFSRKEENFQINMHLISNS